MAVAAAMLLALGAGDAAAQSGAQRNAAVREAAPFRIGPFYFTPALSIDNIGVDTNVFYDPETREPQSDFLISVTPSVTTALPIASRALITFAFTPRADYYRRLSNARTIVPQGEVLAEVFSNRVDLFGGGSFQTGRQRPSFEIERRIDYTRVGGLAGVRYRPRARLAVEASVFRNANTYEKEIFEGVDLDEALTGHETGVRMGLTRRLTAKTAADLSGSLSTSAFDGSPLRDARALRVTSGLTLEPAALIAGTFHVGVLKYEPESDLLPAFTGLIADADLSYTLRGATRFSARWARDLQHSFETMQPYYVITRLGAGVRQQLFGRFDAIASYDQHESSYRQLEGVNAPSRVDTNRTYSGDVGMRLNRRSRVGLRVATSRRASNTEQQRNYRATQIGLSYSYGM